MKVLYIVPDGDDLGGILTSTENLMLGFKEAGHQATFALLRPTKTVQRPREAGEGYTIGIGTGQPLHMKKGWNCPYYSFSNLDQLISLGNCHDVIIWGAMFGLRNGITEGDSDWLRLFKEIKKPHVAMIRDDHLQDRYPWVAELEQWIVGWACVQRSSFDSCAGLRRPRAIIYSGHDTTPHPGIKPMGKRQGLFMMHTFKNWKRADRLVAAVPYLKSASVIIGGKGIEYYYMASETKCKPRYYADNDPALPKPMRGKPIWANALKAGMQHVGTVTPPERDALMLNSRFFVDLSWREHSTGQINRAVVEAIRAGCVPVCMNRFITGRDDGDGELFKAGAHYLPAPKDCTPAALASVLDEYMLGISVKKYAAMQQAGLELIKKFDRKLAAKQLVELALGKKTGDDYAKGVPSPDLLWRGQAMFKGIFA